MYFSTIIDKNYITRLNSLINSLSKHCADFFFYIIALDNETSIFFSKHKSCITIDVSEVHFYFPELTKIKKDRDPVSYLFTLSPYYPLYILKKFPEIPHICTIDADQYFFSSPELIFNLLKKYSVLITPHRFSNNILIDNPKDFGDYNVSFQVFKNDEVGVKCLNLWCKQCFEWCFDRVEDNKYADQKYLDSWKSYFGDAIYSIDNKGVGLAPWNFENYKIKKHKNKIFIDEDELILYHYQGLKVLEYGFVYTYLDNYSLESPDLINKYVYKPIIASLLKMTTKVDTFTRNNRIFDFNFLKERPKYIFKRKYRFIFTFEQYSSLKNFYNGFIFKS